MNSASPLALASAKQCLTPDRFADGAILWHCFALALAPGPINAISKKVHSSMVRALISEVRDKGSIPFVLGKKNKKK
jgi:hypothetical protein